jgi:hypothetical protein
LLEEPGNLVNQNLALCYNQSSMKLEQNDIAGLGKLTWKFNIKLFYITYENEKMKLAIKFCQTDDMMANYITKPSTGFIDLVNKSRKKEISSCTKKICWTSRTKERMILCISSQ